MNAELKAKWIEALRSDSYSQGRGCLRENDNFCCIGVACDLVDPKGWGGLWNWHDNLTVGAVNELGLSPQQGTALMVMNDSDRLSFPLIADWIEAHVQTHERSAT